MPVWLENDAPSTSSRSASFITQLATGVPLRPSTPAGERVVVGDLALRLEGRDHRRAELLGQRDDRRHVVAGAVADDDHRPLRAARAARSAPRATPRAARSRAAVIAARRARRPARPPAPAASAPRRGRSGARRRAAAARSCSARVISSAGLRVGQHRLAPGGDRAERAGEVDLLEGAGAEHLRVDLAGQREHRRAVDLRVPQPGEQVGRARAGDRQAGGRAGR